MCYEFSIKISSEFRLAAIAKKGKAQCIMHKIESAMPIKLLFI